MIAKYDDQQEVLTRESIFIIGHVSSVEGRTVKINVNKNKNSSHIIYEGKTVKNVSVGSYVKIVKGFISIIGKVEGEFVTNEKHFNKEYNRDETKISRVLQVSLFGHFENEVFRQGIKEMPLIDNECYVLSRQEFNSLHSFFEENTRVIKLGKLTEEPGQKIYLSVNKLFANHIGIFGNTGSGKSNTLAKMYTELFKSESGNLKFQGLSKFLIIDFNGEYIGKEAITDKKVVYELSTGRAGSVRKYPITVDNLNKSEVLSVLLEATEKTQKPFLDRVERNTFLDDSTTFNERVQLSIEEVCKGVIEKKDKNMREGVIFDFLQRISEMIDTTSSEAFRSLREDIESNLHLHASQPEYYWGTSLSSGSFNDRSPIYDTNIKSRVSGLQFKSDEINRLKLKIVLNYFREIIRGYSNQEHIGPLLGRMHRKFAMLEKLICIGNSEDSHNLSILSLRDVNTEMKKIIPLIVCKQEYERKKESGSKKSLHIIIDEAHNILSTSSQRESDTWKDYRLETFEEIIKEGRKFGVFLTIASQRPSDISSTIISQLHNYFIHKLINNNDIIAVEKAVAYLDKLSFESIPILSTGSCFIAGIASDIPVKVDIDILPISQQPRSSTVDLEEAWSVA